MSNNKVCKLCLENGRKVMEDGFCSRCWELKTRIEKDTELAMIIITNICTKNIFK